MIGYTVSISDTGMQYEQYKVFVEYYKRNFAKLLGNFGIYRAFLRGIEK